MLTNKQKLDGTIISAEQVTIAHASDLRLSRFTGIVDAHGNETGVVTDRYRLVQNADLIGALDLASDALGVDLEADGGRYHNGNARYDFFTGDEFKVPGDNSGLRSRVTIGNSYGGGSSIDGTGGTFRLICSNGMSVGTIRASIKQRHVGSFDLLPLVQGLLEDLLEDARKQQDRAEIMALTSFDWIDDKSRSFNEGVQRSINNQALENIANDTPKRYVPALREMVTRNRENLGHNVWAIIQAIAEVSSHTMKDTPTARAWERRNSNRILTAVGI